MRIDVDTSDVGRLRADLERGGAQAAAESRRLITKAAADIKALGQQYAPVDTGNLRSSITYSVWSTPSGAAAEIGPEALYGFFVEYGTAYMAPQAYMTGAFDAVAPQLEAALAQLAARVLG